MIKAPRNDGYQTLAWNWKGGFRRQPSGRMMSWLAKSDTQQVEDLRSKAPGWAGGSTANVRESPAHLCRVATQCRLP